MEVSKPHEPFEAQLAELRVAYRAALSAKLARFCASVERLRILDEREEREILRDIAHRLGGSGALYGADAVSAWGKRTSSRALAASVEELQAAADALAAIIAQLS
jgi:hypothetical protein